MSFNSNKVGPNWEQVDMLSDPDSPDVIAVITRHRTRIGKFAVAVFANFKRPPNNTDDQTIWIDPEKIDVARRLLDRAQLRIKKIQNDMVMASKSSPR